MARGSTLSRCPRQRYPQVGFGPFLQIYTKAGGIFIHTRSVFVTSAKYLSMIPRKCLPPVNNCPCIYVNVLKVPPSPRALAEAIIMFSCNSASNNANGRPLIITSTLEIFLSCRTRPSSTAECSTTFRSRNSLLNNSLNVGLGSNAKNTVPCFILFDISLVKTPVPEPNSTITLTSEKFMLDKILRASNLELGNMAPTELGFRRNSATNLQFFVIRARANFVDDKIKERDIAICCFSAGP